MRLTARKLSFGILINMSQGSCALGLPVHSCQTLRGCQCGFRCTVFDPANQSTTFLAATCHPIASRWKTLALFMLVATVTELIFWLVSDVRCLIQLICMLYCPHTRAATCQPVLSRCKTLVFSVGIPPHRQHWISRRVVDTRDPNQRISVRYLSQLLVSRLLRIQRLFSSLCVPQH